jgi:hypothetical protein
MNRLADKKHRSKVLLPCSSGEKKMKAEWFIVSDQSRVNDPLPTARDVFTFYSN